MVVCVAFALVTDHRWEDYYITYRASKNLAVGNGLVFEQGERLHTFTSPIGVLLPALAARITANDEQALWLFRAWSIAAFAGAVFFLLKTAQALRWSAFVGAMLPLWLMLDAKSVDFSINGMETAFMLLLLAATLHTLAAGRGRFGYRLGLLWGLLMWTRPDAFIFGGAISLAWLVMLPDQGEGSLTRKELLREHLRALWVAALVYLPWFIGAWWYYTTPVPHTIVAKGLSHSFGLVKLGQILIHQTLGFPWMGSTLGVFAPSYSFFGGWPNYAKFYWAHAAWVAISLWWMPWFSRATRTFSFVFCVTSLYAALSPSFPWYFPSHAIFALGALAGALNDGLTRTKHAGAWRLVSMGHAAVCAGLLIGSAHQLYHQQRLIEGQRKEIGLWLKEQAQGRKQTVFLECVGYIGYFYELKMLDFPGLTAPEMVAARRKLGDDWDALIGELKPDWLVLRPNEVQLLTRAAPSLLTENYVLARRFEVRTKIDQVGNIQGLDYLYFDSAFDVFMRRPLQAAHRSP